MGAGEFNLIDWFRGHPPADPARVPVGPGDDCAVVSVAGRRVLVTTDAFLDGTHFDLSHTDPVAVGRKAMNASLSDIAAMAGLPVAAVVSVGLPRGCGRELGRALYRGLRAAADAAQCAIVGGDITAWSRAADRLAVSVTVLGDPAGVEPVLRSGAHVGDGLIVTGRLGGSSVGRHLSFEPRLAEARALAEAVDLHAMIDLSDGLSSDAAHIARESGVGVLIRETAVPIHPDAVALSETTGRPPVDHALNDGEDFELLFTVDADTAAILAAHPPVAVPLTVVGEVIEAGVLLEAADGTRQPLKAGGYEHDIGD